MERIRLFRFVSLSLISVVCTLTSCEKYDVSDSINGHQYVDLGTVVNGKKIVWATCNVGATRPKQLGDYFSWGETDPKTYFEKSNYKYWDNETNEYTKYLEETEALDPIDDAASANWGSRWRIPTQDEYAALTDENNYEWKRGKGHYITITSKVPGYVGKSIIIPMTGAYYGDESSSRYIEGRYWLSNKSFIGTVRGCYYGISGTGGFLSFECFEGHTIRAVAEL